MFTGRAPAVPGLISPQHWDDQPFELIVSNPPFSVPWEGDKNPLLINDPRFSPAGVLAPASKGDMAFIPVSYTHLDVYKRQRHGGKMHSRQHSFMLYNNSDNNASFITKRETPCV